MTEDQPPAVVSSSAAPPIHASTMNEQQASQSSPATSDKTTIVSFPDHRASQKPKPPHTFTVSEYLVTSQKPLRSEPQPIRTSASPPLPPLIVRSNNTQGVVDHARRMLENSPARYLCFFPQCGYTIYDAWDSHDIRIDSAEFLTKVLTFITRDNVYRAQTYAHEWSQKNRHRLDFIAGEVPRMYNSSDPISIVDRIFINGETQSYPREFLWHVANIMRNGMVNAALKPQGTIAGDNTHNVEKADDNDRAGNDVFDTNAVMDAKPDMLTEEKTHRSEPNASNGTNIVPPTWGPLIVSSSTASTVQPSPATHPTQTPPFVPSQLAPKGYPNQPAGYAIGVPPKTLSPHMNASSMRYPKGGRNARQGSGSASYNQPPSLQSRTENHPMESMSGHQPRRLSGAMSASHSPRFTAPPPMGIHPIMSPGNPMMPFPQHPATTVPHMAPGQISYGTISGSMMHPSMIVSQSIPYSGSPIEFAQQNYPYGPPAPRGMQIGDMKNNPQHHPYNAPPQRIEQHFGTNRRMSYHNKQPGLFNPYGADKPDFGTIPSQQGMRKAGRNSFSNPASRGRKASLGSYNRLGYGQHPLDRSDRGDRNGHYGANRQPEAPCPRSSSNNNLAPMEVDPTITSDKERGCDEGWIGPHADYVTSLWVCNLPRDPDPTEEELTKFFETSLQVPVINVKISLDKNDSPIAYINFHSSDSVRKGLAINGHYHRGRSITVKVPRQYYTRQDSARTQGSTYYSSIGNAKQSAKGVSRASTSQPTVPFSRAPDPTNYSPQDARSGLSHGMPRSHVPEVPVQSGSPEVRKPKKQQNSPTKKAKAARASTTQESSSTLTPDPTQDEAEEPATPPKTKEPHPSLIEQETNPVGDSTKDIVDANIVKKSTVAQTRDVEPHFNILQSTEKSPKLHPETLFTTTKITDNDISSPTASVLGNVSLFTTPLRSSEPVQPAAEKQPQDNTLQEGTIKKTVAQESLDEQQVHGQTSESVDVAASALQSPVRVASSTLHTELDEEDKNDLSYHSAQEMQSDIVAVPEEEKVPSAANGMEAAAGVEPPAPTLVEADTTPDPRAETIESPTTEKPVSEPEKSKQAINVPKQAAKTESLSIFAKSKAQKKKDKDAQKKEKKKKAKAGKAQPSSALTLDVTANDKVEPSNRPAPPQAAISLDSTFHARMPVVAKVFGVSAGAKTNLKDDRGEISTDSQLATLPTNDVGVQGDEEAVGGKIPIPKEEIEAETQVPKIQYESSTQSQNQDTGATALSYERASETEVSAKNTDMLNAASAREESSTQVNETKQQHGKKNPPASNLKVAIPNLKDMERKLSASSRGSAIDPSSAKPKATAEMFRSQAKVSSSDEEMSKGEKTQSGTAPESASMSSSTTLQGVASPIMSPSPTRSRFHTPVQTPTALSKPKKKKKNKSKKKAPTDPDEPFAEQLHEIEEVKGSLKSNQEVPYYNKHAARLAETLEESAALDKQIADSDLMALVQAYYPQKETLVQPQIERSFDLQKQDAATRVHPKKHGSNPSRNYQSLSSEILTEVIEGRKVPHGQQILEKDGGKVLEAGNIPFFLPKEEEE